MTPYFEQDGIRIYLGDCREVLPSLGVEPDLTVADPPYNQTSLTWDSWPEGWTAIDGLGRSMWCFGSLRMFMDRRNDFLSWNLSQDIVWEKHNGSSFHADRFRRVHEQAAHFYRGEWESVYAHPPKTMDATARTVRRKQRPPHMGHIEAGSYESHDGGPRLMRSVIYARSMHRSATNETQKPEALVAPLVDYACPIGGLIVSPFCGSGTDLVIARLTRRRAIGIDVRESQCEAAAIRLQSSLPLEIGA